MNSGSDQIEALIQRIDREPDSDAVRREAARLILHELEHERESLKSWEKMHYEMAIALLPTVWLRLCLTHLRMAMEAPSDDVRRQVEREHSQQFEAVTVGELVERVKRLGF
jgi:hypothetical protein